MHISPYARLLEERREATMHDRFIKRMSRGGPLNKAWLVHVAAGAIAFGIFSYPSSGASAILIPLFLISGITIFYGMLVCPKYNTESTVRIVTVCGLGLMALAGWTRAIVLWGEARDAPGHDLFPTLVWLWIAFGLIMLMISTWARGVE